MKVTRADRLPQITQHLDAELRASSPELQDHMRRLHVGLREWRREYEAAVNEKPFYGVFNVRDYGARGDDSTNDTTSIQSAIDAALTAGGGVVFFPLGTYRVSAALTINYTVILRGIGPFRSVIKTTSATANIISIDPGANGVEGIEIHDLGFATTTARTAGATISVTTASSGRLDKLRFSNLYSGVDMSNGFSCDARILSLYLEDVTIFEVAASCSGFFFRGKSTGGNECGNVWMTRCRVMSGDGASNYGIIIDSYTGGFYVTDCSVELNLDKGLYIANGLAATDPAQNLFFTNLVIDYCNTACLIDDVWRAHFTQCWFSSSTYAGIQMTDGADVSLSNCFVIQNGTTGILLNGGTEVRIEGSQIENNSLSSSGTYDGILVAANVGDFIIVGNHFTRTGITATQRYSVNTTAGTGDNYIIAHNNVRGYVTGGVNDAAAGANIVVANNLA